MAEYDLVCDVCGQSLAAQDAVLSWREDMGAKVEADFTLAHPHCLPANANARREGRALAWPNGYLAFFAERFSRIGEGWRTDAAALQTLLHALAPFVMRPDNAAEMDSLRAASFGQKVGVKPGAAKEVEGGK
jgi:hypothetical protein